MSDNYCNDDFEFEKEIDIKVDTDLSWEVCNDFYSDAEVDYDICAEVDIDSNIAFLGLDAEAIGCDTLVEVYADVLTVEDELSHVSLTVMSAIE